MGAYEEAHKFSTLLDLRLNMLSAGDVKYITEVYEEHFGLPCQCRYGDSLFWTPHAVDKIFDMLENKKG